MAINAEQPPTDVELRISFEQELVRAKTRGEEARIEDYKILSGIIPLLLHEAGLLLELNKKLRKKNEKSIYGDTQVSISLPNATPISQVDAAIRYGFSVTNTGRDYPQYNWRQLSISVARDEKEKVRGLRLSGTNHSPHDILPLSLDIQPILHAQARNASLHTQNGGEYSPDPLSDPNRKIYSIIPVTIYTPRNFPRMLP